MNTTPTTDPHATPTPKNVARELHGAAIGHRAYARKYIRRVSALGVDMAEVARLEAWRAERLAETLRGEGLIGDLVTDVNRDSFKLDLARSRAALRLLAEAE